MPYERPGRRHYVLAATRARNHGAPAVEDGFVGVVNKQKTPGAGAASGTPQKQIAVGEPCVLIKTGVVQVPFLAASVKGTNIWINTTSDALAAAGGANLVPFGKVTEIQGQRGTPTGFMRVNLDEKGPLA